MNYSDDLIKNSYVVYVNASQNLQNLYPFASIELFWNLVFSTGTQISSCITLHICLFCCWCSSHIFWWKNIIVCHFMKRITKVSFWEFYYLLFRVFIAFNQLLMWYEKIIAFSKLVFYVVLRTEKAFLFSVNFIYIQNTKV